MKKETLVTEVVTGVQERLSDVIMEIGCLNTDCESALFVIREIMETISKKPVKTEMDVFDLQERMERIDSFAIIAYDYLNKIQSCISDIVLRERQTLHESVEGRQEIKNGVPEISGRGI